MSDVVRPKGLGRKRISNYLQENPHLIVSVGLFCGGGAALWQNIPSLAGSLFGAGGALLGAWITELNRKRADAKDKTTREVDAVAALSPELQRVIERLISILDRTIANFVCETSANGGKTNDLQGDFRPYLPTLYPNSPQIRDLPGQQAIALIRFYDSLDEISKYVDDWWEREGQLAVNIFNVLMYAAERSLRLGLVCARKFDLEARFPSDNESRGTLTSRIERSLDTAVEARQHHSDRSKMRRLDP